MDRLTLYSKVPLSRWVRGYFQYITNPVNTKAYPDTRTLGALKGELGADDAPAIHGVVAMNAKGDFTFNRIMPDKTWYEGVGYSVPSRISESVVLELQSFKSRLEQKGARFALTGPIRLQNIHVILASEYTWERIETLRKQMSNERVPFLCDFVQATFASVHRFDTPYRANKSGASFAFGGARGVFSRVF